MNKRHEQAVNIVKNAGAVTVEYMEKRGYHQCSEVLDESAAVLAVEDELGDTGCVTIITRTCSGFIVWSTPKKE